MTAPTTTDAASAPGERGGRGPDDGHGPGSDRPETAGERDSRLRRALSGETPVGLTLAAGAVVAAALVPIAWLVATALDVGAGRAASLLTRPGTVEVFANSVALVVAVTGLSMLLSVPLAYATVRTDVPLSRPLTVALALPLVVPSYLGAFAVVSAFGPRGTLQSLLAPLGVESLPRVYGLGGTTLVLTLYTYPYVYITARAALKSMDTTLVDAARTLRHSRWRAFRRVTLPQIRPAIGAGALLVALYTLSDFGTPQIMRFDAFTRVIYVEYNLLNPDYASLLSLQLLAVTLLVLAVESRIGDDDALRTGRQGGRVSDTVRLGRWRWPVAAACALVPLFALGLPVGVFGAMLVAGPGSAAPSLAFEPGYALNSVGVSAAAALAAALAGLPVAYLAARHGSLPSVLMERAAYVGYAVPGVVMGLAVVFFGSRYLGAIYQTLPLLVFAYVVRFLPQAVGSAKASFLQVNPQLPEAARTLGRTSVGAFRDITLPLVAPGLLGGAALVFLTTMKELPATLLLQPAGFDTLVTHIWRVQQSGHYGHAAVPALILVVVSGLSMLVLLSQEGYDVR